MSDDNTMKAAIVSMLPKGAAWEIAPDGELDHLLDAMGDGLEERRADLSNVGNVRNPLTTSLLSDLEIEMGIVPETDISEATRRAYLNSVKNEKPKTGSDDHLEALLVAAGFDVIVLRNDPPVDPSTVLMNVPNATCGDPTATCGDADTTCGYSGLGELLVNGDSVTEQEPLYTATCGDSISTCGDADTTCGTFDSMRREYYNYPIPENPARWPFFFWVCGGVDGLDDLIDWNMEMSGEANWPPGGGANVQKVMSPVNSGIRSLKVSSGGADLDLQRQQPANPDADLDGFYRMDDVVRLVENLAWLNELVDGNMEKPGTDVIVDGDMEVTGPDVIVDGDMEVTGPDVIVDGDMEAAGAAAWGVWRAATLTKAAVSPHSGTQNLKIAFNGDEKCFATQGILVNLKTYRIKGWARSDGVIAPKILTSALAVWVGTTSTSWQPFDFVILNTDVATLYIGGTGVGAGQYTEFDDITVTDETVACAAWTVGAAALLSKQEDAYEAAQCLRIQHNGTAYPYAQQSILTIAKTYRIKGVARGDGTKAPQISGSGGVGTLWTGTTSAVWQAYDEVFVATGAFLYFQVLTNILGTYAEFDDVEVIDETVACAAWTATAALLSKQEDPHGGVQCIRVQQTIAATSGIADQAILVAGKTYRVKGWARSDGVLVPQAQDNGGGFTWSGSVSASWQEFDITGIAVGNALQLKSVNGAGIIKDYVEFDDVFVIDLDAGAADYTNAGNTVATKREESPQSGQRCLRVINGATNAATDYVKPTVDALIIGNVYHIAGYARGSGTAVPSLKDGAAGPVLWTGTASTGWLEISFDFKAVAVDLRFYVDLINDYAEFDQMIVNRLVMGVPTLGADASNANGINVETPWIEGIEFDGSTAKIDAGAVNLPMASENMTMITWVNFADYAAPATQGLITNGSTGADRQGLYLDAGLIRYVCVSGTSKIIDTGISLQYVDGWRGRIGVTRSYDGIETVIKLFVNGVLMDSLTFTGAPDVTLTQAWIGWLTGASFLNGTIADNVSMFNSGKSDAYMLADYEDGIAAMLAGPYAEQIPDPITTSRPLDGFAWGNPDNTAFPLVYILDTSTGLWNAIWIGESGFTKQTISETLDNIGGIRLYCKGAIGLVNFDDISISDPVFTYAEIPPKMRDKFRKLVLKAKRLGTYAGLLVNWTGDAP